MNISRRKIVDIDRKIARAFRAPTAGVIGMTFDEAKDTEIDTASVSYRDDVGVPRNIQLDQQTLRTEVDGSSVVDVVISFDSARGAASHEVRISKL